MDKNLVKLREDLEAARQTFLGWQMTNVYGKSAADLVEIDIGLKRALANLSQAETAYNTLLNATA